METVKGYVEHIVFRNEDNGYTVYNLNNDDYMSEVVNRAGLEEDLQRIVKSKKHLLENKNYVLLDDTKQFTLFYDHASPIQKNNVSIKTRTE